MTDGRHHKYYPDLKIIYTDGKTVIVEIKPKRQTKPPKASPKRKPKTWYRESKEWGRNQAKWESAIKYCQNKDMEFKILTEVDLGLNNPYK